MHHGEMSFRGARFGLTDASYLGGMVDDRGDLLGVTLEGGHDLLLGLIEHHHVLVSPAWRCAGRGKSMGPTTTTSL